MKPPATHPGEATAAIRPSRSRAVAGILALVLVVVLEVVRRDAAPAGEGSSQQPSSGVGVDAGPVTVPVAPTLPPAPSVLRPATRRAAVSGRANDVQGTAAARVSAPSTARLLIDFEHGIKSGLLAVSVDGQSLLEEPLKSRITRRVFSHEFRKGRVRKTIEVPPGRRKIRVSVRWGDRHQSNVARATFREGGTRRLVASLAPVTRALRLYWR